jgi:hypothetical protein
MSSSPADIRQAQAAKVRVTSSALLVDLTDGRTVIVPLQWYPRLAHGTLAQRRRWRLVGGGEGIHWPELDEDISVNDLLAGRPSAESQASLRQWLRSRGQAVAKPAQSTRRARRPRS